MMRIRKIRRWYVLVHCVRCPQSLYILLRSQMEKFVEKMNAITSRWRTRRRTVSMWMCTSRTEEECYGVHSRYLIRMVPIVMVPPLCVAVSSSSYDDSFAPVHAQRISMKKILSSSLRFLSQSRLERLEKKIKKRRNVKIGLLEPPCPMISTSHESIRPVHMSGELQVSNCETFSSRSRYERLLRETEVFPSKAEENIELFLDLITQTTGKKKGIYEI